MNSTLYDHLKNTTIDAYVVSDMTGRIIDVNRTACSMYGYSREELLSLRISDIEHQFSPREIRAQVIKLQECGYDRFESRHACKDGSLIDVEISVTFIEESLSFIAFHKDITDRKNAEKELESEIAFRRALFDHSPDGMLVIDMSTTGFLEFNTAAHEQLGYTRHEFARLSIADIEVKETREETSERIKTVIRDGMADFETLQRTRNGDIRNVHVTAQLIHVQEKPVYFCIWRDITDRKKEEAILYEKEQYLQAIIDTTPECIKLLDRNGQLVMMNPAGLRMIEADSLDQVKGARVSMLVTEEFRPEFDLLTGNVFAGESCSLVFEATGLKGSRIWLDTLAVPLYDVDGTVSALLGITRNITGRKKAEADLKHSHELMQYVIEHMQGAVAVHDRDMKYLFVSQRYLDDYKITEKNIIGKHHYEVLPDLPQKWRDVHQRVLAGEILGADEDSYPRDDGTLEWTRWECRPWYEADGSVGGIIIYTELITERKQAELAILDSRQQLMDIIEFLPDATFVVDNDKRVVAWNRAIEEMTGVSKENMIGRGDYAYTIPFYGDRRPNLIDLLECDREELKTKYSNVYKIGEALCAEAYTQAIYGGKGAHILAVVAPLYDLAGHKTGTIESIRDITSFKHAEEERLAFEKQLLHAQKLESLGVLAGGIAHDFNNILMTIIGNADLAMMRMHKESPATENLLNIEKAAARAAELAKQMLAYSGKGKFVIESLDLNILIHEMLHMLEVSISKKAVLRQNLMPNIPAVEADATQIRQILMNLVINASEAIGDKSGVIAINTGCMDCDKSYLKNVWMDENISEGLYVYLEVSDTGCGMSKETLGKLFDPFFTTKFTGRGLGMAAVLGIVRGHNGAIKVYSELNKGTTFKILLPASNRPVEIFNSSISHDDWKGSGTVLLVDDEETVRGIGAEMLKELGYTVITACDGREAVRIFRDQPDISLVLLDLTMPHMDGEQCFRELKQIKPGIKVIMSSGFNEQEVTEKFMGKGLAGFIQKPYKLSTLHDILRGSL